MRTQVEMDNDVIWRNHARGHGLHDHLIRTAEARRRQAEAIANGVHWLWANARRAVRRLMNGPMNGKSREQTPATNGKEISKSLGRASLADAFRRDLVRLAEAVRRFILEPYSRRRRRMIAIDQLGSLDDRLLADIGVTRGQIELAVDGMLARRGTSSAPPAGRGVPAGEARVELPLAA